MNKAERMEEVEGNRQMVRCQEIGVRCQKVWIHTLLLTPRSFKVYSASPASGKSRYDDSGHYPYHRAYLHKGIPLPYPAK